MNVDESSPMTSSKLVWGFQKLIAMSSQLQNVASE